MRPRRSLLFVPGDQRRKLERAASAGADAVVLDLEDGVSPANKAAARGLVACALRDVDYQNSERVVRVAPGPDLVKDLIAAAGADAILVPKVDRPADLDQVVEIAERELGNCPPLIGLLGETPGSIVGAGALAEAGGPVVAWMWGSEDLAAAVGCRPRGPGEGFIGPLALARATAVLVAATSGTQAIDTVYPFYRDSDGLLAEAQAAAQAGFSGKGIIHPCQVGPVHDAFTPTAEQADRARAVIEAFSAGEAVIVLDGQMLDLPHLRAAERLLSRIPST